MHSHLHFFKQGSNTINMILTFFPIQQRKKLPVEEENPNLELSDDNFLMEGSCIKVVPPWGRCRWQKVLMAPNAPTPTETSRHLEFSKTVQLERYLDSIFVLKAQISRLECGIKTVFNFLYVYIHPTPQLCMSTSNKV